MHLKHFGDSYDIVKQSLLRWLAPLGKWSAHPMFTHDVDAHDAAAFERFLGVPLLSCDILTESSDRHAYFSPCTGCEHVFLDPDTGIRMKPVRGHQATAFVFGEELVRLSELRPASLTLVFDQSVSRGTDATAQAIAKLDWFFTEGLHGFSYVSHASFVVLGREAALVEVARQQLLSASALPKTRIVYREMNPSG